MSQQGDSIIQTLFPNKQQAFITLRSLLLKNEKTYLIILFIILFLFNALVQHISVFQSSILISLIQALLMVFIIRMGLAKFIAQFQTELQAQDAQQEAESYDIKRRLKLQRDITHFVFNDIAYEPTSAPCIENFRPLQLNTECIFAKAATVWGSPAWDSRLTLEENVKRSIPHMLKFFSLACSPYTNTAKKSLDAFAIEIQQVDLYAYDVDSFAESVRRVLYCLSEYDPSGIQCMHVHDVRTIGKKTWHFSFNGEPIFVTTFAPFYPSTHPRYQHGITNAAYVMFQPEFSFNVHDIGDDYPMSQTNWNEPKTVRDKIRKGFKDAGRPYKLPMNTISYPVAIHTVKPLNEEDEAHVKWFIPLEERRKMTREELEKDDEDYDKPKQETAATVENDSVNSINENNNEMETVNE